MIEFKNVTYRISSDKLTSNTLDGISLKIAKGEKVALLGLNGSGKTTLLKLAASILIPDNGEVLINSISTRNEKQIEKLRKSIGFIFQNPDNQIITSKVESELVFTMENLGFSRSAMNFAIEKMTAKFDIKNLLDRHTATLSGGERQRVVLASVLAVDPEILLLDEPGSFLDQPGKGYLTDIIFSEKEKTVISATQFPAEVLKFDRLIYLDTGKILYDDQPQDFFSTELWTSQNQLISKNIEIKSSFIEAATMTTKTLVSMKDVSFSYNTQDELLKNINIEIDSGKITGIIGNSGSGKTTIAMLLAGLLKQQNGKIEYSDNKPAICFQFPEDQFFADTIHDEVAFALKNEKVDSAEILSKVKRTFEILEIDYDKFSKRNPFKLSGGEKRLVAIASILIMQRKLVIFDEPTAGLDWVNKENVIRQIYKLKQNGFGIVLISHDLDMIIRLSDQLSIIDNGQIIWQGDKFSNILPTEEMSALFGELPNSYNLLKKLKLEDKSNKHIEKELLDMTVL